MKTLDNPAGRERLIHLFTPFEWPIAQKSMNACGLGLQAREQIARSLHRQALVIKAQAVQTAQLLARPCAARTAVIALRHDDAVSGMGARDGRVDHEQPSMAWPDCAHHAGEKRQVFAVDRSDQGAAAPRDQTGSVLFITIGHDGRSGTEDLYLVHSAGSARRTPTVHFPSRSRKST